MPGDCPQDLRAHDDEVWSRPLAAYPWALLPSVCRPHSFMLWTGFFLAGWELERKYKKGEGHDRL